MFRKTLISLLLSAVSAVAPALAAESVTAFSTPFVPGARNPNILYDLNCRDERFDIWVPANFNKNASLRPYRL